MPRATAARILVLALVGGVLFDIVVPGNAPGIGVLLLTIGLLGAAAASGKDGLARMDRADLWLAPVAVLMAAFVAVRSEPWLVAADVVLAAATSAAAVMALGGARITRGLVPAILDAALEAIVSAAGGALDVLDAVRPRGRAGLPGLTGSRQAAAAVVPVARGLLIAIPMAALFVALFASADAVFATVAGSVLAWRPNLDVAALAERTVIVSGVAWGAAGLLALSAGFAPRLLPAGGPPASGGGTGASTPPPAPRMPWGAGVPAGPMWAAAQTGPRPLPRLGPIEATTVLAVLDALFAGFVGLQIAYLFGGRDTIAAAGISYADYARRGFLELVVVALVAGVVIVALDAAVVRRSRAQLVASLCLLALSVVVLASALARLRLYQEAFGWTELRFVVLVAIGWLAVAIIGVGVLLSRRQSRWLLHVLGITTVVAVAGMNVVGPGTFVAEQNLARAADPSLVPADGQVGFDAAYLDALGDAAVPPAVAALPALSAGDRAAVGWFLERRKADLAQDPAVLGWPAWNLDRQRARDAIAAWRVGAPSR